MKKVAVIFASIVLFSSLMLNAKEHKGNKKKMDKSVILLVAFGTSIPKAQEAFKNIQRLAEKRFPKTDIKWAYTSKIIRKKLAKQGQILDSPLVALSKLIDEGYNNVAVQSLHTIPGAEYDDLCATVEKFKMGKDSFEKITIGAPLLSSYANLSRVVNAMLKDVPKERKQDEAVVFMGHGSEHHAADLMYLAFQADLNDKDPNVFIGTVEGHPTIDDIIKKCKKNKIKKAYLIPFMSVAGDHAMNDMAGDEDDSWKSILTKEGIECVPVMRGTAEIDEIVNVWLDNLEKSR